MEEVRPNAAYEERIHHSVCLRVFMFYVCLCVHARLRQRPIIRHVSVKIQIPCCLSFYEPYCAAYRLSLPYTYCSNLLSVNSKAISCYFFVLLLWHFYFIRQFAIRSDRGLFDRGGKLHKNSSMAHNILKTHCALYPDDTPGCPYEFFKMYQILCCRSSTVLTKPCSKVPWET